MLSAVCLVANISTNIQSDQHLRLLSVSCEMSITQYPPSSCLGLLDSSTSCKMIALLQWTYNTVSLVSLLMEMDPLHSHLSLFIMITEILGMTAALVLLVGNIM